MVELGYDMRGHRSKNLREFMGYIHSRYVITVCGQADASCPRGLWSSGEKLYWPFDDPAAFQESDEEKLAYFRKFVTRSRLKSSLGWKRSKLSPSLTDNSQLRPPELLGLLAHPIRWRLVKALTVSDRRVQELVETLAQPYNLVSYHLKLLRQAEIVELRKSDADSRDLYYSVNMNKLQEGYQNVARAIHPAWDLKEAGQAPVHIPPRRVLFLCTHNSARSQIAEGFLRQLGGNNYLVASAGNLPRPIHPEITAVMKEFGVDVSHQYSKHITDLQDESFDEVITVCDQVREACPNYEFCNPTIHWSIPDPAEISDPVERRVAFARTAHEIERRIRQFILSE